MKDTYYFSHDCNARNDEKILMLRANHGWEGYGLFWALVEMMFENEETSIKHSSIKGIALACNIDITKLEHIINTTITEGLFCSNGEVFWSESLRRRKQAFHELREKRSRAGKKGMESRWGDNIVITNDNKVITKNNKGKESIEKENILKETIVNNNESAVFEFYGKHFPGAITPLMRDKICSYLDEMDSGLIIYAMEKSALAGKKTFSYAGAILDSWLSNGIKTLEAAKAADEEYRKNKEQKKKTEVSPVGEAYKLYVPDFIPKEEPTPEGVAKIADLLKSTREKLEGR